MKIEIEVKRPHIVPLASWASLSRTLNEAKRLLTELAHIAEEDGMTEEAVACAAELEQIEPALNALHHSARTAMWLKLPLDRKEWVEVE